MKINYHLEVSENVPPLGNKLKTMILANQFGSMGSMSESKNKTTTETERDISCMENFIMTCQKVFLYETAEEMMID